MKTFGMLLLVALTTSPALTQQDDQKISEVRTSMLGEATSDSPTRLASDDRMSTEGSRAGRGASQPAKGRRAKNGKPLQKAVAS